MDTGKLRIGQLASKVAVAVSAIRYYEEEGLLGAAERSEAGYRLYDSEAVGRVQFIQRAKALGLTLEEIKQLVRSRQADTLAERAAVRHLVAHKIAETKARVSELTALEAELEKLYLRLLKPPAEACGHVGDCACWLPTEEEVMTMATEITCCGQICCPSCSCTKGEACDCSSCSCNVK